MDPEILVIGESLIDIVRQAGQPAAAHPGGSSMNTAVGLGRLGHSPTLATWIGRDEYGQLIADHCAQSHVTILPGSDGAPHTATADAAIDAAGQARYTFDFDWRMPPIPDDERPWLVHTGSLGALFGPGGEDVCAYIESQSATSLITFDPNCRPSLMGEPSRVRALCERYVEACSLVKVSDEDLAWLYPATDSDDALLDRAHAWAGRGASVVVVTLGARGALAVTAQGDELHVPPDTSHGLVDTVGAGDSFMAGLIHGWATGWADHATPLLGTPDHLQAILNQAATIAGITVSRAGANPPWLAELPGT